MITERLLADPQLNLSRTGYGQMNFWATLLGAFFCLGIGSCIDRFGIRRTLAVVMVGLGVVVLAMTKTTSPSILFVTIMLTRGFGQSALSVVSIAIVGKWFDRNVSFPMAVYSILMAGGFIAAALIGRNYADLDWRAFWSAMGWAVLGLAVVLTVIARDRTPSAAETSSEVGNVPGNDYTHGEAMRTPMFWVCSLSISLYGMIVAGISLFNESILVDQGFRKEVYYESLALGTGMGVVAKMCAGLLGIYWPVNRLLSVALMLLAGSLVWLTQLASYQDVVGYVIVSAARRWNADGVVLLRMA
ncbi:MAG: MFS transporter [Planctomycetaceae bacterium]